ncbi:1705_t:CDS:2, partial [Gigaspora margarita]
NSPSTFIQAQQGQMKQGLDNFQRSKEVDPGNLLLRKQDVLTLTELKLIDSIEVAAPEIELINSLNLKKKTKDMLTNMVIENIRENRRDYKIFTNGSWLRLK